MDSRCTYCSNDKDEKTITSSTDGGKHEAEACVVSAPSRCRAGSSAEAPRANPCQQVKKECTTPEERRQVCNVRTNLAEQLNCCGGGVQIGHEADEFKACKCAANDDDDNNDDDACRPKESTCIDPVRKVDGANSSCARRRTCDVQHRRACDKPAPAAAAKPCGQPKCPRTDCQPAPAAAAAKPCGQPKCPRTDCQPAAAAKPCGQPKCPRTDCQSPPSCTGQDVMDSSCGETRSIYEELCRLERRREELSCRLNNRQPRPDETCGGARDEKRDEFRQQLEAANRSERHTSSSSSACGGPKRCTPPRVQFCDGASDKSPPQPRQECRPAAAVPSCCRTEQNRPQAANHQRRRPADRCDNASTGGGNNGGGCQQHECPPANGGSNGCGSDRH